MLHRYSKLREFIAQIDDDDVGYLIPDIETHTKIFELLKTFVELDSVTTELQDDATTLADARFLFDAVIHRHSSTKLRLAYDAKIEENVGFESGISKIQRS